LLQLLKPSWTQSYPHHQHQLSELAIQWDNCIQWVSIWWCSSIIIRLCSMATPQTMMPDIGLLIRILLGRLFGIIYLGSICFRLGICRTFLSRLISFPRLLSGFRCGLLMSCFGVSPGTAREDKVRVWNRCLKI